MARHISRTLNLVRVFIGACAVAALVASGVLLFLRDVRGAVAAAVVAVSALTFVGTARTAFRSPALSWLGFGLLGSAMVILGFPIATVVVALAGLFLFQLAANAFVARRIGQITFERLDHSVIMPGAEALVQRFSSQGFAVIGGYRFHIGKKPVMVTVMIGPERDRLAVVSDLVWYVISRFEQRALVTSSSGVAPVPPGVLRQLIAGGRPADLVRAHHAALTILSGHSRQPEVFATDEQALDAVRQHEEGAIAFLGRASLRTALRMETERPAGGLLSEDPDRQKRVDEWIRT